MIKSLFFFLTILFFSLFSVCGQVQTGNKKAESEIYNVIKKTAAVGLSVAVVKKGKLIYTESFGLKSIEQNIPLTDKDIFRIASISKSFAATAIMQLVESGKLSLEDDFSDIIGFRMRNPKYPETIITLKMLMSHTSGINDSQGYFNLDVINPEKNPDWAKCYNDYEPGKGYKYCNLNYNLIGAAIENRANERFDNYIKNHILTPLNLYGGYNTDLLDSSRFSMLYEYNTATGAYQSASPAYVIRKGGITNYIQGYSTPQFSPTGGMKISATDLAKYMMMHMHMGKLKGNRVISKKSAELMQTPVSDQENYGLGLLTTDKLIQGKTLIGHTGSAYGLYSAMFFQPKEKFGIVVITNGCKPDYTEGFIELLKSSINILYDNFLR